MPIQSPLSPDFTVAARQGPGYPDGFNAPGAFQFPDPETLVTRPNDNAVVVLQVLDCARNAALRQVRRGRAKNPRIGLDVLDDQVRLGFPPMAKSRSKPSAIRSTGLVNNSSWMRREG